MNRFLLWLSLLLYLATAGMGVWVAYDRGPAWEKFLLVGIGLAAVYGIDWLGRLEAERTLVFLGVGAAVLAAGLGALPLISGRLEKVIQQDLTAAALVSLLPMAIGSAWWFWQFRYRLAAVSMAATIICGLAMLILTQERSAWAALLVALLCGWLVNKRFSWAYMGRRLWFIDLLAIGTGTACLVLYTLVIITLDLPTWLPLADRGTVVEHLQGWRNALVLIQDYPFTGSGLSMTGMVYSTYVLLYHVPYQTHVHNLFLQIAIEQGLLGLFAFLSMTAAVGLAVLASWQRDMRLDAGLRSMAVTALLAVLIHGLLDSELYTGVLMPLLFLPFGFVAAAARLDQYQVDDVRRMRKPDIYYRVAGALLGLTGLAAIIFLTLTPGVQAAWQANLGSVAQTQAELSVYSWPEWAIQDEVRRDSSLSLAEATAHYQAALALDPKNVTAHRRLGQIALSRGDYDLARQHLETAIAHAPTQQVNRQLLLETYAVTGRQQLAVDLWQPAKLPTLWLQEREWWYRHIHEQERAEWLRQVSSATE